MTALSGKNSYLKSKQYYIDLYDRLTVDICRNIEEINSKRLKNPPLIGGKEPSKEMVETFKKMTLEWNLMFETGDRYIRKEETIARWMGTDQEKDDIFESAEAPRGIRCLTCQSTMSVIDKDLWGDDKKSYRISFLYECPNKCLPRRSFYDNGEEWKATVHPCPKCNMRLKTKDEVTDEKFITTYDCPSCGYTNKEEFVRTVKGKDIQDEKFLADRERFCLSKEEGEKWKQELLSLKQMGELVDKWKERDEHKELYEKVAKLQRLTIADLEKFIIQTLEKKGYIKFQLSTPEIGKDVIVPFGVYDSDSTRLGQKSEADLKHILKKTLEGTNWRLMSEGVSYRLGFLQGRLKGYEREEDLIKLIKN